MPRAAHDAPAASTAASRLEVLEAGAAREFFPPRRTLPALRRAAAGCRGCDLWERATQTVFGEGPARTPLLIAGEQPGDVEDEQGRPFVGPAGRLLDRVLEVAGIDRSHAYVTNAVKHFKWEPRGKRRIHQKPNAAEVRACGPWIAAEIEVVRPRVVVCLGATAAEALLGRGFRVTQMRGELLQDTGLAPYVMATVHPSAVLRSRTDEERRAGEALLVEEFRRLAPLLEG